jgi:putative hydrolase of HD superfamily
MASTEARRLQNQVEFLVEIDRLKSVLRRTPLVDGSRLENSAEHSWHIAVTATVLAEHAPAGADLARAIRMALIHDLVEIDAGDTFCYDAAAKEGEAERERRAADRIFSLLPADQREELRALWEEFCAGETPDARFANAVDRLQPLLLNVHSGGGSWRTHAVTRDQVLARMQPVHAGLPALWPYVEWAVAEGVEKGFLR